jgi:hypothetical protein
MFVLQDERLLKQTEDLKFVMQFFLNGLFNISIMMLLN